MIRRLIASSFRAIGLLLTAAIMLIGGIDSAAAHSRSESFSTWHIADSGFVSGSVSMLAREATRIPRNADDDADHVTRTYIRDKVTVAGPEGACPLAEVGGVPRLLPPTGGYVRLEMRFDCRGQGAAAGALVPLSLSYYALFDLVTAHIHYARVKHGDGVFDEQVLTFDRRTIFIQQAAAQSEPPRSAAETVVDFLLIGFDHIIGGYDHLAFLAAVMLLAGQWRIMALAITGFTIGHALTIALAVLQVVTPDSKMIEAAIGYTIALVAIEYIGERTNMSRQLGWGLTLFTAALAALAIMAPTPRMPDPYVLAGLSLFTLCYMQLVQTLVGTRALIGLRVTVTGLFGLIHGFGFGGSLLDLGIGRDQVVTMLIGFNLGVELGQLAIIAAALAAFLLAARLVPQLRAPLLAELMMSGLAGLGLYWFLGRAFML